MIEYNIEYWVVEEPDGGGMRSVPIAKFMHESDAILMVKANKSNWPRSHRKETVKFRAFENYVEYLDSTNKEKIKNAALAKLSTVEREALGL